MSCTGSTLEAEVDCPESENSNRFKANDLPSIHDSSTRDISPEA